MTVVNNVRFNHIRRCACGRVPVVCTGYLRDGVEGTDGPYIIKCNHGVNAHGNWVRSWSKTRVVKLWRTGQGAGPRHTKNLDTVESVLGALADWVSYYLPSPSMSREDCDRIRNPQVGDLVLVSFLSLGGGNIAKRIGRLREIRGAPQDPAWVIESLDGTTTEFSNVRVRGIPGGSPYDSTFDKKFATSIQDNS